MNSYELSRRWFDWCFENPEKINPSHTALYFFAIEHCNRLGWKEKFGFPSQMAMEALGIKNWRTYSKILNDLIDFGFIQLVQKSKNQYSSNIIAIVKNTKASTKALDKALQKHSTKQSQSTVSIDKQVTSNKEQVTKNNDEGEAPSLHIQLKEIFLNHFSDKNGLDFYWTAKDGKALKQLISKLKFSIKSKDGEKVVSDQKIIDAFVFMLSKLNDKWVLKNLSIPIINSKYNEIISSIKNKSTDIRNIYELAKEKYGD